MANIKLYIRDKNNIIIDEEVRSVSSYNEKGDFDILENHANFISLIKNKVKINKLDGNIDEMEIKNGILKVVQNKVDIYLGS